MNATIQQRFSKAAARYDSFSDFHRQIADDLAVAPEQQLPYRALLDIGCGTGYLTGRLKSRWPQAQIIGLDFARGMLDEARLGHKDISWVLADAQYLPFADSCLDAVFSNLAYQWAVDLPRAFGEARRVLVSKGIFVCTLFGKKTCWELLESLNAVKGQDVFVQRLPDADQVRQALKDGGFGRFQIDTFCHLLPFENMFSLMHWLKAIGANHLNQATYWGRKTLMDAQARYHQEYKHAQGVCATFEIIKVYAQK